MEPWNRLHGNDSARICSLAGRYDNPIPTRFLAPIESSKIPALCSYIHFTSGNVKGKLCKLFFVLTCKFAIFSQIKGVVLCIVDWGSLFTIGAHKSAWKRRLMYINIIQHITVKFYMLNWSLTKHVYLIFNRMEILCTPCTYWKFRCRGLSQCWRVFMTVCICIIASSSESITTVPDIVLPCTDSHSLVGRDLSEMKENLRR